MHGYKVGNSAASMGYQWVNYPGWMGFYWNAHGESLECLGACPNDTPWTVPESLPWSIVAPVCPTNTSLLMRWIIPRALFYDWEVIRQVMLVLSTGHAGIIDRSCWYYDRSCWYYRQVMLVLSTGHADRQVMLVLLKYHNRFRRTMSCQLAI